VRLTVIGRFGRLPLSHIACSAALVQSRPLPSGAAVPAADHADPSLRGDVLLAQ